ncbi:AMP-binding protein [Photobacterium galatheae]|uniref:AMP-dependent synthetase/ligase domain-containing protein n=1 Tax=Photobacterium galatheae TaxID=1654360 RepID=A0A066RLK6_9GAMM|nr:AMP-binding protein [Photobacterium galatheae]KDM90016.1 hypothetical protein EA58_18915 [Photobacterium galatheae]MCM0149997.1 AMP-binding protein [Photobacterium galatheae]
MLESTIINTMNNHAEKTALIYGNKSTTFSEVNQFTLSISQHPAVNDNERIAVIMEQSDLCAMTIISLILLGKTVIPFDKKTSLNRMKKLINSHDTSLVITDSSLISDVKSTFDNMNIYNISTLDYSNIEHISFDVKPKVKSSFILFTSGSTGMPKSVSIKNVDILKYIQFCQHDYQIHSDDVLINHAPFGFLLSFFELFSAFITGATLVIPTASERSNPVLINDLCSRHHVSIWNSVPSLLRIYQKFDFLEPLTKIRLLMFAGEAMEDNLLEKLRGPFPNATFISYYGTTETNTAFKAKIYPGVKTEHVSFGFPLPYVKFKIVDIHNEHKEVKEGHLLISSDTMMDGYLNQTDDDSIVKLSDGNQYYRSKDIVKLSEDGLIYVGRLDWTIKVAGNRVSVVEVENTINQHPNISQAVVIPVQDPQIGNRLDCIIEFNGNKKIEKQILIDFCKEHLNYYAIPSQFMCSSEPFPLNKNQKVDRNLVIENYNRDIYQMIN